MHSMNLGFELEIPSIRKDLELRHFFLLRLICSLFSCGGAHVVGKQH